MLKQIEQIQKLAKETLSPVYAVIGEENYFKNLVVKLILKNAIDDSTKDFNYNLLSGSDCEGTSLVNLASSYPMMSDYRVILIRESEKIPAAAVALLKDYITSPLLSTVLIFEFSSGIAGGVKRGNLYKTLSSTARIIEMKPLYDNIGEWIHFYAERNNKRIDAAATRILAELTGTAAEDVVNEMDKLFIFTNDRDQITEDDVRSAVGISKSFNVFELCNSVGKRDLAASMLIANRIIDYGEKVTNIIFRLSRHLTNLLLILISAKAMKRNEIAALVKVNPFFVNDLQKQAGNFSIGELESSFFILRKFDEAVKTGYYEQSTAVYLMLYYIIKGISSGNVMARF